MTMLSALVRSFALAIALLISTGVSAFTISPMSLQLASSGGTETLLIKNPSNAPIEMGMKVFAWEDSRDLSSLGKTQDLLAMPPIFTIPPNGEQTVRIALRKPLSIEREATYRIVLDQIPSEVGPEQGVNINFSVNLPIFVQPEGAEPSPEWAITKKGNEDTTLILTNGGDAHIKLADLTLVSTDGDSLITLPASGQYIFGGEQRTWSLDPEIVAAKREVTVKADTNVGLIKTVISLPDT